MLLEACHETCFYQYRAEPLRYYGFLYRQVFAEHISQQLQLVQRYYYPEYSSQSSTDLHILAVLSPPSSFPGRSPPYLAQTGFPMRYAEDQKNTSLFCVQAHSHWVVMLLSSSCLHSSKPDP